MRRLVSEVACRQHPVIGELPLVGDVPLRYVRGLWIHRHVDVDARGRKDGSAVDRERTPAGISLIRIAVSARSVDYLQILARGRIRSLALVEPRFIHFVQERAAYAKRVFTRAARIPYQSGTRCKIRFLPIPHGLGNPGVAIEEQSGGRVRIDLAPLARYKSRQAERRAAPVFVRVGEGRLPAQSKVQS